LCGGQPALANCACLRYRIFSRSCRLGEVFCLLRAGQCDGLCLFGFQFRNGALVRVRKIAHLGLMSGNCTGDVIVPQRCEARSGFLCSKYERRRIEQVSRLSECVNRILDHDVAVPFASTIGQIEIPVEAPYIAFSFGGHNHDERSLPRRFGK
jgi:hypothetical protein